MINRESIEEVFDAQIETLRKEMAKCIMISPFLEPTEQTVVKDSIDKIRQLITLFEITKEKATEVYSLLTIFGDLVSERVDKKKNAPKDDPGSSQS